MTRRIVRARRPVGGRRSGFILIEVVLALGLFVGAASVIVTGLNAALNSTEELRLETTAANLAFTVFSKLQMGILAGDDSKPHTFGHPDQEWTWKVDSAPWGNQARGNMALERVEVTVRHKHSDMVYRLAQVVAFKRSQTRERRQPPDRREVEFVRELFKRKEKEDGAAGEK